MTTPPPAPVPPDFTALRSANDKIRSAAKWLIGSSAAVGAALLAGSQLSNIGKLTPFESRFVWAVVGALVGLVAVVWAISLATRILLPITVTIDQLERNWNVTKGDLYPAVKFFKEDTTFLTPYQGTPTGLKAKQRAVDEELQAASLAVDQARVTVGLQDRATLMGNVQRLEQLAQHKVLEGKFQRTLRWLIVATALGAAGIVVFAWASNPPAAQPPTADLTGAVLSHTNLRDANLANAVLDHADFTKADLTGANLHGASVNGVVWHDTVCPDGVNSDRVGGTCAGHLGAGDDEGP